MSTDGDLRKLFRQAMPQAQWTTIETGAVAQGVPDAEFIFPPPVVPKYRPSTPGYIDIYPRTGGPGVSGWIEFKQTGGWAVTLRPEQIGWLSRRVRHGGRAFIAVRRKAAGGPRTPKADELYLIPLTHPSQPAELRDRGLKDLGIRLVWHATWTGGPGVWDWTEVAKILNGETE